MKYAWIALVSVLAVFGIVAVILCRPGEPEWGAFVDPDGDCSCRWSRGVVTIQVPGKDHDLGVERGKTNAPRVLMDAEGDFVAEVRVSGLFQPRTSGTDERAPYHGAGLVLFKDDTTYVRLEKGKYRNGGDDFTYANFELRENGRLHRFGLPADCPLDDNQDVLLRLERRGDVIRGAASHEGADWHRLEAKVIGLPHRVQVGILVVNTSQQEFSPTFSDFRLTREASTWSR